jgi:hypothetical protein
LLASTACSIGEAASTGDNRLAIYRVKEKPSQEGMLNIVRQELGCEPCEELRFDALPGTPTTFLMNPEPAVSVDVDDINEVLVIPNPVSENTFVFQLTAQLNPDAARAFEATKQPRFSLGLTVFRGQRLGIAPLLAPGGLLQIGAFATQVEAERVGQKLGLLPKVINPSE